MKVIEEDDRRLVVGGWSARALLVAIPLVALFVGMPAWMIVDGATNMIFVVLFCCAIAVGLMLKLDFHERITLDRNTGQIHFEQLRLTGPKRRWASMSAEALVEIDQRKSAGTGAGRASRRMVLVDANGRTPFSTLWFRKGFEEEAALLNRWLKRTAPNE